MTKFKAGDKIVFAKRKANKLQDTTFGKIYSVVYDVADGELCFIDDAGDYNYAVEEYTGFKPTKIIE